MNKTFRKIVSSFLVLSLVFSYIPCEYIYANYQSLVTTTTIANRTTSNQSTYTLDINWAKPNPSSRQDTASVDGNTSHVPEGYKIYSRNGTKRNSYALLRDVVSTNENTQTETITSNLDANSIYSYYVNPYHTHTYIDRDGGSYTSFAPQESGSYAEALNLTDITISAESVNGGFKVTWGNPTYMGANVFSGYTLYYVPETTNLISKTSPSVSMSLKDDNVIFNTDGTITYTFQATNIAVGQKYSIKIEPLYNGVPIRYSSTSKVTINGKDYPFSYPTSEREFRYNGAYVKPSLYIKEEGTDNIRLYWNEISTITGSNVSKVEIYSYDNNDLSKEELIGTLAGTSTSITSWLIPTPKNITSYKIVIHYADGTSMESNIVVYDPTQSDFEPYRPIIHKVDVDSDKTVPDLTVYWQAFLRKPYTEEEKKNVLSNYKNLYNDTELKYKIWISDDLNNLNDNYFQQYYILENQAGNFATTDVIAPASGENTLAYYNTFNQYYTYINGSIELQQIKGNKIYYIKIQAIRNGTLEESEFEYYSVYVPPNGDIDLNPLTMGTPPLRIERDEKGAEIITDKTINIEWDTKWFEVYDVETDTWHSVVGLKDGVLVYGKDALNLEDQSKVYRLFSPYLDSEQTLESAKALIQNNLGVTDIPVRKMDISSSNYEIFTVKYNYLEEQGGYETYYEDIKDSQNWLSISPNTASKPILKYTVTNEQAPTMGTLSPNTAYVIYMRTYTIDSDGNKVYAYNPSYVTGNTINSPTDIIVTPTTQVIEAVSSTDTTVTYRWEYTSAFTYTLKYSSKVADYPNGGIIIDANTIKEKGRVETIDDKMYIYLTIDNLFPNTTYYAWINATSKSNTSDWSTPASIITKDLEIPPIPTGLGLMGTDNVKTINEASNKQYEPTGKDYIIVEWTRLYYDTILAKTGIINDNKGYGAEILFNNLITSSYGVKFNGLSANKRYFFRVKSRYMAVKTSDGRAELSYSYIISMANNEDFIDALEFEVPLTGLVDNGKDIIVKESEWSKTVSFITGESNDEYDGDFDPNLYPLPDNDFEIIYNPITGEVTYEFRGPGLDSTGMPNNGSDQRFISKVINEQIYDFSVDLSKYNGNDIKKGKVVIPYSIISALEKQKVSLTIKTGNMYTKVDLGIFADAIKSQNISGINANTKASISISDITDYSLGFGESFVSTPQKLSISLTTDNRTVDITTVQKPINISLAIDNRYIVKDSNVNMYKKVNGSVSWTPVDSQYKYGANKFYYDTKNTGLFTVISKQIPLITAGTQTGNSENAIYSVNKVINIADMPYYDPNTLVTANQFNNLVWAVANGETTVNINDTLSSSSYTELGRSKLLVSGSYVTREKGIASLARLYELKTKQSIVPVSTLANQGYSDAYNVDSQYQQGVNKAIDIGLLNDSSIRPKDNMTLGEFMEMLEYVVLD